MKSRKKISIGEDLMKVALLYNEKQFTSLIERINTYRKNNRRGVATREYLLFWHWKKGHVAEAEELADELLALNENSVTALSFFTNRYYLNGEYSNAVEACQKLSKLNPSDASSVFFEKVLLGQGKAGNIEDSGDLQLAQTLAKETSTASVEKEILSGLGKEIFQYGFASIPIEITQFNFHHLVEKASPKETSKKRRIISRTAIIKAKLILRQDFLEVRAEEEETEKISHIINTGFSLPETLTYEEIERLALRSSVVEVKGLGWFTFQFKNPEDQSKLNNHFLLKLKYLKKDQDSIRDTLLAAHLEKKKEKGEAILYLSACGIIVAAIIIVYFYPGIPELDFPLTLVLILIYLILGEIWRTLIAFWVFAWKKIKLRRWIRNMRFNGEHFLAFFKILLEESLFPKEKTNRSSATVVAPPFALDLTNSSLKFGQKSIPFADIQTIQVSDQKLKILSANQDKISLSYKGTEYEKYLPLFCSHLGDKMELI